MANHLESNYHYQIKDSDTECLLIPMLMESGEERRKYAEQREKIDNMRSAQQCSIAVIHEELRPKVIESDAYDIPGWSPCTYIFESLLYSMRKYKNDSKLLEIIEELCTNHDLLVGMLDEGQYKCIMRALCQDHDITNVRLQTMWFFTQFFISKASPLKLGESGVWGLFQDILKKYC